MGVIFGFAPIAMQKLNGRGNRRNNWTIRVRTRSDDSVQVNVTLSYGVFVKQDLAIIFDPDIREIKLGGDPKR